MNKIAELLHVKVDQNVIADPMFGLELAVEVDVCGFSEIVGVQSKNEDIKSYPKL